MHYFSVKADEVTDHHGKLEVQPISLTFIDKTGTVPHIRDAFLHVERATGQYVANAILGLLNKHDLDVQHMQGKSFDSASVMAGEKVKKHPCNDQEGKNLSLYSHCHSHVLSLTIGKSCSVQVLQNIIDIINEMYLFFHLIPRDSTFLSLSCVSLKAMAPNAKVFAKLDGWKDMIAYKYSMYMSISIPLCMLA